MDFSSFFFLVLITIIMNSKQISCKGMGGCTFHETAQGLSANCRISSTMELLRLVPRASEVIHLDLSNNGLTKLHPESFVNFEYLTVMNLSGNPILNLQEVNFITLLPHLTILDLSNTGDWLNTSHMINKSISLHIVRGTPLDNECFRCFLKRYNDLLNETVIDPWYNNTIREMASALKPPLTLFNGCYGETISFKGNYHQTFQRLGYDLSCAFKKKECSHYGYHFRKLSSISYLDPAKNYNILPFNKCWQKINEMSVFIVVLTTIGMVMNMTVVLVTMRTKTLKQIVSNWLVANMALGNLILTIYLIVITGIRASIGYKELIDLVTQTKFCNFIGFTFVFSQGISAFISFLVTFERFLAVVYCMKPDIRIFANTARRITAVIYLFSLAMAILPYTALKQYFVPDGHCVPVSRRPPDQQAFQYMLIPGTITSTLYIISVFLYIKMYKTSKKSGQALGIDNKRERKVAWRIFQVVATNMIFFYIPLLTLFLITFTPLGRFMDRADKHIFWKTFIYYSLAISLCLNPTLYAFRNRQFTTALRQGVYPKRTNKVGPAIIKNIIPEKKVVEEEEDQNKETNL